MSVISVFDVYEGFIKKLDRGVAMGPQLPFRHTFRKGFLSGGGGEPRKPVCLPYPANMESRYYSDCN